MKSAILLCMIAFTFAVQAQTTPDSSSSSSEDDAKEGSSIKNQVTSLFDKLKFGNDEDDSSSDKGDTLDQNLKKMNDTVDEMSKKADNSKVLECKSMTSQVLLEIGAILKRGKDCIFDKLHYCKAMAMNITVKAKEVMGDFGAVKDKYEACFKDADGLMDTTIATACLTTTGVEHVISIKEKLTPLASDVKELEATVKDLPTTLKGCIATTLTELKNETQSTLQNVKQCISNAFSNVFG